MLKKIGYIIFAIIYRIGCIRRIDTGRYFCVMTHDGSDDSSVGVVVRAIKNRNSNASFVYVKKDDRGIRGLPDLVIRKAWALARAGMVLMDNEFLPLAYINIRKGVKVVQLWHGTGTIKKFGHDAVQGNLLKIAERADSRITHLIVNSEYTARLYQSAFGVTEDKVYLTGIPRTDIMFDDNVRKECISNFYNEYPYVKDKRIILYAPTFRDEQENNPVLGLDIKDWVYNMDSDTVLLLRMHPHVASVYDDTEILQLGDRVINVSRYNDLNTLLFVADALITDYSSIVFEYVLLDRPMYFYAYDIISFSNDGRGFYENYEDFVPGPVVRTTKELIEAVNSEDSYSVIREQFKNRYYKYLDGRSTDRLINTIM